MAAHAAANCSTTVSNASFGSVAVLAGGSATAMATLNFTCTGLTPAVPVTLCPSLDGGSGGADGSGGRLLSSGTATIPFQIYQDSGHTQPWGSATFLVFGTVPTITAVPGVNGKINVNATLFATVSAPQTTPPGTYTSTFTNESFLWGLNLLSCAGVTLGISAIPAAFTFTASVTSSCSVTATNLSFGATVGLLTTPVTSQNTVNVLCTATTPYTLGLGPGLYGTTPSARQMANGANRVTYAIYKDAGWSQVWGDLAAGASTVQSATGTGGNQAFTGYGKVPAQITPAQGSYSDTVVATATY
jgi:spore coat protein U-like protein